MSLIMKKYLIGFVFFCLCFVFLCICIASSPSFAGRFSLLHKNVIDFALTKGVPVKHFTSKASDKLSDKHPFARATIDNAFKNMLVGGDADTEPLLSFLKAFTGINVAKVEYTPTALPVLKTKGDKQTYLDVSCVDNKGHHFIAEVQVQEQDFWNPRALYYASGRFSQQLDPGDTWPLLKPVVAINILDHDRKTLPDGRFRRDFQLRDVANAENASHWGDLNDPSQIPYLRIIQYELPRVKLETIENKLLRQWLQLLKNSEALEKIPSEAVEPVKKAYQRLDRRVWGPQLQSDYTKDLLHLDDYKNVIARNKAEGLAEGEAKGQVEGQAKGEKQAKIDIAKNLIKNGVETKIIQSSTGLTTEQIETLRQGKLPAEKPTSK
jgi:predicted transposase/invertase (TIGR01784 family)